MSQYWTYSDLFLQICLQVVRCVFLPFFDAFFKVNHSQRLSETATMASSETKRKRPYGSLQLFSGTRNPNFVT